MDNATKKRLVLGFLSNWISRLAGTVIQLVGVPVFLHFWSVPLYGEWLIVTALPTSLSFANIGFGSIAANEMSILMARNDRDGALRTFQSTWWLITLLCSSAGLLLVAILYFVPLGNHLKLTQIQETDAKWIVFYLGISILLGQFEELLQACYRCVGRYPFGSFMKSCITLFAFAATLIPVVLGYGPRQAALALALANSAGTLLFAVMIRRDVPWIRFGWQHARMAELRRLLAPSVAFMAFPIGNALNLQGSLFVIGYAIGPTAVVVFATARTVSRVALQMVQMVNSTFWPELSTAFGQGDFALLRKLHRRACQLALIIAVVVVTGMLTVGPWFLKRWTGGHVPPSPGLLSILLLVVVFYALWSTSSTLVAAINQHQRLAAFYLVGTSLTVVCTFFAAKYSGLNAAAATLLISEFIMNFYVLPASLRISEDTFGGFTASLFTAPASLHPRLLLNRILRRSRPALES